MSDRQQDQSQKNNAAQGIDQSTIKDVSDIGTEAHDNMQSQLGKYEIAANTVWEKEGWKSLKLLWYWLHFDNDIPWCL